jgi:hypothetical protein
MSELIEILTLLENHDVQMTGERHDGCLCVALRKGGSYIEFELPKEWEMHDLITYYFVLAIEALNRNEALEAEQKDGA